MSTSFISKRPRRFRFVSGATFEDGSFRLVIDDVQSPEGGPVLRVRTSRASASLDRRPPATFTYFLRNRRAGEAYAGDLQAWRAPSIAGLLRGGTS